MKKTLLLTTLLLVIASPAKAALNEYYTYGGFSPVTIAFQNLAAIFADHNYKGAITVFALLGLFFAGAGGFINLISGKGGPLGWLVPFLTGSIIYFSMYVPVTNLYVYDPVYNQNLTVSGIPVGVAYTAGLINHLERFVVDVFDANAAMPPNTTCGPLTPMQYQEMGGAVGLRLMQNSSAQYVQDANAAASLNSYINDCVQFELTRPGSTLTLNTLLDPGCGKSALDAMGQAASPANYTTDSFVSPPTSISCQAAYNKIQSFYTGAANAAQPVSNACGGTSFSDQARCQQIFTDMLQGTTGESIPAATFIGNNTVASITSNTLINGGGGETTQYMTMLNQAQNGQSSGFMAGIMNPYMIDGYVAYSFMLMPILALFLVTPLWKNAFTLSISLVAWTCLLRSLDVITFHQWAVQYQQATAAALNNAGSGLDASMRLPTLANQYLGTFASMRNAVFLLATAVSGALFKFGDSAISRLADRASAAHDGVKEAVADRGVAAQKALSVATGAARAEMVTALAAGAHGWENIGGGLAANELSSAASGSGALAAAGGNIKGLMSSTQQSSMVNHSQDFAKTGRVSQSQANGMGVNDAEAQKAVLQNLGSNGQLAGYMADMATKKNIGETKGAEQAWHNAQASGYKGDYQQFAKDIAQVGGEKNFADSAGYRQFVTEKFGGNEAASIQAITDVAAFQQAKHSAEVNQTMSGTGGSAVGAGGGSGIAGGDNNLMSMASDNVRRAIAEQNVPQDIKKDPALYHNGHLTEAGYAAQMGNIAGANQQSFVKESAAYGPVEKRDIIDRNGHKIMGQEKGSVHSEKEMHALAKELRTNGFTHSATELDAIAKKHKGFDFQISRDGQDHITGFSAVGGATAQLNDKATVDRGRLDAYTMKQVHDTRDQKLSGSDTLGGARSVHDNSHRDLSGSSSVKDNSHKTLSGTSSVKDNSHKTLSGTSSVNDNSHSDLSGSSSVKDNSHRSMAGTSSVLDDTHRTLTGTSSVDDNSHKTTDLVENVTGKISTDNRNLKVVHAGTVKTGTGTELVGKGVRALGGDEATANYVEEVGATVGDLYKNTVAPIANEVAGSRSAGRTAARERVDREAKGLPNPESAMKRGVTWAKEKMNPEVRKDEVGRPVNRDPSKAQQVSPKPSMQTNNSETSVSQPQPAGTTSSVDLSNSAPRGTNRSGSIDNTSPRPARNTGGTKPGGSSAVSAKPGGSSKTWIPKG